MSKPPVIDLVEDLDFIPSKEQRQLKAAFWSSQMENPLIDPEEELSLEAVKRGCRDRRLNSWWKNKGFRDWFQNREEFRQRVEYVAQLALDTIEEVLMDRDANPSARVNAAKLAIEVANKLPPRKIEKASYLDEEVNRMDEKELTEFIKRRSPKLIQSNEGDS